LLSEQSETHKLTVTERDSYETLTFSDQFILACVMPPGSFIVFEFRDCESKSNTGT
jgi:hypothetical protein